MPKTVEIPHEYSWIIDLVEFCKQGEDPRLQHLRDSYFQGNLQLNFRAGSIDNVNYKATIRK